MHNNPTNKSNGYLSVPVMTNSSGQDSMKDNKQQLFKKMNDLQQLFNSNYYKTQLHIMCPYKSTAKMWQRKAALNATTKKQQKIRQKKTAQKFACKTKCTGAGSVTKVCWAAKWAKGETLSSAGEVK